MKRDKRLIVSKGDGKNYLGYAPDGEIHNMRKSFGGGFYKVVWKETENEHLTTIWDSLKKSEFILQE